MIGLQAATNASIVPRTIILPMIFAFMAFLLEFKKPVQTLPDDGSDCHSFLPGEFPDSPKDFRIDPDRKHLFWFAHISASFQGLWGLVLRSTIVSRLDLYVRTGNWVICSDTR